jgi:Flp pilus assembly protein TadD
VTEEGDAVQRRLPRLRALSILTALAGILAAGALIAITAMTAIAAVPPNLGKAVEAQKRLATGRPQDAAVFNDLGNLLVLARQPEEAEAAYRHAVELDAHRTSALFNLALLLQQKGKTAEAKQLYEKVLEVDPRHAWAHYQLGTLYEQKKDKSRAIREYSQSFALDPQLAFREVNPQIVENRLVTESLLLAYRRHSAASEAPAIYDEPGHIRDLLLPPQPVKDGAAEPKAIEAPPTGAGQHPAVLRRGDLPANGNVGQATPPGSRPANPGGVGRQVNPGGYTGAGVPGYTGAGVPGYTPPDPNAYPGARVWGRPNPVVVNPNMDATQPGQVVTPPPSGLYYRPGTASTGRLGTQVVPEQ